MASTTKSGIQTSSDGTAYIPSSTRADGTKRTEIRVRPGYRPPEDVETYKTRSAEAWKNRGSSGVPGAEEVDAGKENSESRSKNAKRREAAKRKQEAEKGLPNESKDVTAMEDVVSSEPKQGLPAQPHAAEVGACSNAESETEIERQKKIRNLLKKLRAIRELKEKKINGEKLSPDQLMKIGKEEELVRDLKKLNYDGVDLLPGPAEPTRPEMKPS